MHLTSQRVLVDQWICLICHCVKVQNMWREGVMTKNACIVVVISESVIDNNDKDIQRRFSKDQLGRPEVIRMSSGTRPRFY